MSEEQLRLGAFRSVGEEHSSDEIPVGYKKTEVGIIPEDWRIAVLSELCQPNSLVRGPFGSSLKKESFVQSGYKVYEQGNAIYADCYLGKYYISEKKFKEMQRFRVDPGDFIISCSGTIGKIFQIPTNAPLGIINQALLKIKVNREIVLDKYFFFVFIWEQFQSTIIESIQGGAMKNLIGMREFRKVSFALPPISEQHAISEVLTAVDNLIESLDNLISKKQAIKKATMQQLLTGRTRLPGFNGGWKKSNLGKIGKFLKGNGIKRDELVDSGYPCILYGELYTTYKNYILNTISRIPYCITNVALPIETGDLLFTGSGETPEEIGKCSAYIGKERVYAGGDIVVLRSPKHDSVFLSHLMNHSSTVKQKSRLAQGDAVVHISARHLSQIEICLPPIEEQRAISSILIDMDAEIDALERQRGKMKQIKQGMLQQLLTGRIRLLDKKAV